MKRYWVIGHPLNFCLSTPVMNGVFEELGIEAEFETKDIAPESLDEVMEQLKKGELDGLVTTMPHKTPSLSYLDEKEPEVEAIDAVNLTLNEAGSLHGYNTDWRGALNALKSVQPELKGLHIHVLGAGGAARAACYGLQKEGARVSIWNRTPERAKDFAEKTGIEWIEDMRGWEARPDIIVNATSLSYQEKQSTLVPYALWEKVQVAMDAVYGKTSLFLEEAKAAQVKHVLSGEVWFLHQFLPMFKLVAGQEAPVELAKKLIEEAQLIKA